MKFEPSDLWNHAMTGGVRSGFIDAMTGYQVIHGVKPQHFLVPKWMYVVSRVCLGDSPAFAGIPLAPYDTDQVIPIGGPFLPDGEPIPGLTEKEFQEMMGTFYPRSDHATPG